MRIHLLLLKYCLRQRFEAVLAEPGSRPSWHVMTLCICSVFLAALLALSSRVHSEMQVNRALCPSAVCALSESLHSVTQLGTDS